MLKCPKCGSNNVAQTLVEYIGTDKNVCYCTNCGHQGSFEQFRGEEKTEKSFNTN
jgi:transcription elongation factor Elf1